MSKIEQQINQLEAELFNLKVKINSTYQQLSKADLDWMLEQRLKLKYKRASLWRNQERKEKLERINKLCDDATGANL